MKINYSWYKVVYPEMNDFFIGEVYGSNDSVIGKTVKISASNIKDVKQRFGYKIQFRIIGVRDQNTCVADIDSIIMMREWIGRLVRHNIRKMDVVVPISVEGKPFKIKYICIISKTNRRYSKLILDQIAKLTEEKVKGYKLKDLVMEILNGKLQIEIQKKLNKVYPIRNFEVRMFERVSTSKPASAQEDEVPQEAAGSESAAEKAESKPAQEVPQS